MATITVTKHMGQTEIFEAALDYDIDRSGALTVYLGPTTDRVSFSAIEWTRVRKELAEPKE